MTELALVFLKKVKVIGIDPAIEIANNAIINGIETVVDFLILTYLKN